jgi:chitin disaccharide deacetylase
MKPASSTLERLGFDSTDRVVILHADDIGMCHATIPAFENLLEFGLTSRYAIMAPCAWASEALEIARKTHADVGVHITLTSEWTHYRWAALSTRERSSGLLDGEGFFPRGCEEIQANVNPAAALIEMRAQFKSFFDHDVEPTHMDSHMLSTFDSRLLGQFVATALEFDTPALFPGSLESGLWMNDKTKAMIPVLEASLAARRFPLIDHVNGMPLSDDPNSLDDHFEVRLETAKSILQDLKPGVTHFAFHPSVDTPELRAICPDWRARVGDELVFRSPKLCDFLNAQNIQVIGYRALKNLIGPT